MRLLNTADFSRLPRLAGLLWLPNYTSRDHGIRRTQGQEGRLAVTGRVTWCSMIRRHDNLATMLSIQQHKLYEGLEGGDNERVAGSTVTRYRIKGFHMKHTFLWEWNQTKRKCCIRTLLLFDVLRQCVDLKNSRGGINTRGEGILMFLN